MPSRDPSLPMPLCFMPPKGAAGSETKPRLTPTIPESIRPASRGASSAYHLKNSAAYATSPNASARVLPSSREINGGEVIPPCNHQFKRFAQYLGACSWRARNPVRCCVVSSFDREYRVFNRCAGNGCDYLLCRRIDYKDFITS